MPTTSRFNEESGPSTPSGPSRSKKQSHHERNNDAPTESDSLPFVWTCGCLNVQVHGRIGMGSKEEAESGSADVKGKTIKRVWVEERGEQANFEAFLTYDTSGVSSFPGNANKEGDTKDPPGWRRCLLCNVNIYKRDISLSDEAASSEWVDVDLSNGIQFGPDLSSLLSAPPLPFSRLNLDLPSRISQFGRPPDNHAPNPMYRLTHGEGITHNETTGQMFIPKVPDPFFLPPPFLPAHALLRTICDRSISFLQEAHNRLEQEVVEFALNKTKEMEELQEKVRNEVDLLWSRYTELPGFEQEQQQARVSRSSSVSRSRLKDAVRHFSPSPSRKEYVNPILAEAALSPPYAAGSLLAASLSANAYTAPRRPEPQSDQIDSSLAEVSKLVDKKSDARAVAMSHVFSVLDDTMQRSGRVVGRSRSRSTGAGTGENADENKVDKDDLHGKDSWIDAERSLTTRDAVQRLKEEQEDSNSNTPKPARAKELSPERKRDQNKDKSRSVSFREPGAEAANPADVTQNTETRRSRQAKERDDSPSKDDEDDYVFDFELEEPTVRDHDSSGSSPRFNKPPTTKPDIVEENLSKTFAADFPSHRAAWREYAKQGSMLSILRRRGQVDEQSSDDGDHESQEDESQISKLAISMPVGITLPKNRRAVSGTATLEFERKTSLSDRKGILVPPLKAAMRQKGVSEAQNSLGLSTSTATLKGRDIVQPEERVGRGSISGMTGARSASVSRERNQTMAQSFIADPGAVFETLADSSVDDDEANSDGDGADGNDLNEEGGGTLRGNKFVPPHLLAGKRNGDKNGLEPGWRSLISE